MNQERRSRQTGTHALVSDQVGVSAGEGDGQMQRIERIGKQLFEVANCVITLKDSARQQSESGRSISSIEAAFCASLAQAENQMIVSDTRNDAMLSRYRPVSGAPYIRFYAGHPIRTQDNRLIGTISLIDYAPRPFDQEERQLLADLATLVERELELRSMSISQLDLQKKNKSLRRKSLIDPLIGTWNRGAIMRILTIEAIRCDKAGLPLSLVVVDLDYFKKINDTYGHPAGDSVLVKIASRLRSCIRPQEALGRYGGEEFLVILPGSSHETAMAIAERMRAAIATEPAEVANTMLNLTISAGVASTDLFPTATTEELINHADIALYSAKNAGRNCVAQAMPPLS